jgi:uncharacterized membrane protein
MNDRDARPGLPGLEAVISYILIVGVIVSVALEITGLVIFYRTFHNFAFSESGVFKIQGHDFFGYILGLLRGGFTGGAAVQFMTAGIVVLLLTPFLRVVFSMGFFARERDYKFVIITLFVLVVLTVSLTLH